MNEFIVNKNSYIGYFKNMIDDLDVVADALKETVEEVESDTLKEIYIRSEENQLYEEIYEYITVEIFVKVEEFADIVEPFTIRTILNNTNRDLLETEFNALNKMYTIMGVNITELIRIIESKMILDEDEFESIFSRIKDNIQGSLDSYYKKSDEREEILKDKYRKSIWLYKKLSIWEEDHFYTRNS